MSVTLKVAETSPKFVGRGIALVDPGVIEKALQKVERKSMAVRDALA